MRYLMNCGISSPMWILRPLLRSFPCLAMFTPDSGGHGFTHGSLAPEWGVVSIMDRGCPLRATCWPFIIPKTNEKVSLIFNLVDLNEGLQRPASFSLDA